MNFELCSRVWKRPGLPFAPAVTCQHVGHALLGYAVVGGAQYRNIKYGRNDNKLQQNKCKFYIIQYRQIYCTESDLSVQEQEKCRT